MFEKAAETEWSTRCELAAAYRLADSFGWMEGVVNHFSVRVPGEPGSFLINAFGQGYEDVTAGGRVTEIMVETGDAMHFRPAQVQPVGDSAQRLVRQMAESVLHVMQDRQERPETPGMTGDDLARAFHNIAGRTGLRHRIPPCEATIVAGSPCRINNGVPSGDWKILSMPK